MRESTEAVKSQTDILSDTARRQLRAYVVLESGRVVNVANPIPAFEGQVIQPTGAEITNLACGPVAFVQIKNAGQTPAYRVAHWGGICFREYPLVSPLPAKDAQLPPMPSVLGPGIGGSKMLFLNQLSSQQIADLRDGTGAIYIYGEITYIDAFEVERFTRYRAMHHRIGGVIGVSTDLSHTEEGNEAN
jgi:hypothetical protein